jgi:hypothetical protein
MATHSPSQLLRRIVCLILDLLSISGLLGLHIVIDLKRKMS